MSAVPGSGGRPRLLDLYCGAGGAGMGYHRAGFDVTGVDIQPQPRYPFRFWQLDVRELEPWVLSAFDAVHASPPCQAYTTMNNRHGSSSPPLIAETRMLLERSGRPWVIENVPGARRELRGPYRITGEMAGLGLSRPRLFETSIALMLPPPTMRRPSIAVYGKNDQRRLWTRRDGSELRAATLVEGSAAMGIDWMEWRELCEAIPPAYTQIIGEQLLAAVTSVVPQDDAPSEPSGGASSGAADTGTSDRRNDG